VTDNCKLTDQELDELARSKMDTKPLGTIAHQSNQARFIRESASWLNLGIKSLSDAADMADLNAPEAQPLIQKKIFRALDYLRISSAYLDKTGIPDVQLPSIENIRF
jgi:hypothetical protein